MYTRFIYYMSSPAVSCLQSALCYGAGNFTIYVYIYTERAEKRRKAVWRAFYPSRPRNRAGRKESSCIMQSDIYRGACQRERNVTQQRALYVAKVHIDLAARVLAARSREEG